ncbi:hypothetical protein H5410_047136 [Solanum commersonii]|uniref:Uncharacterized protein n=1 Tax=Solanum commersonii TaxID=4109 RepID=A0A9J5XHS1_SOLCO|nr:hypothetical protein H5410_047136 [Solanum commersonii]
MVHIATGQSTTVAGQQHLSSDDFPLLCPSSSVNNPKSISRKEVTMVEGVPHIKLTEEEVD